MSDYLSAMVVLRPDDEVQGNVLLILRRRDFKTSYYLKVSLSGCG
jgi:hypothetical protein